MLYLGMKMKQKTVTPFRIRDHSIDRAICSIMSTSKVMYNLPNNCSAAAATTTTAAATIIPKMLQQQLRSNQKPRNNRIELMDNNILQ